MSDPDAGHEIRFPIDPEEDTPFAWAYSYVDESGERVWVKDVITFPLDFESKVRRIRDAARGRKQRKGASKGGRARKGQTKVPPGQLRAEVEALMAKGEGLTNARRRVAMRHGIGLSTVRYHTPTK